MSFYDDASLVFLPSGEAGKDGKAYSMKPTDGSGDFTFSRGSNLTATRIDSNGLIEKGRENLLTYSNSFDLWNIKNVTSGHAGYDGTNDAWLQSGTSRLQRNVSLGTSVYSGSVYVKAGFSEYVQLYLVGSTNALARFELIGNGAIATVIGGISPKIEPVSGATGWYRISTNINASIISFRIYPQNDSSGTQTDDSSIYIQDAQLEQGLVATEPIESGATTGKAGLLEDSPRFDYSGGASCPSLLLEGSRTNLIEYSEYFDGFSKSGPPTLTLEDVNSPEGVENVYSIVKRSAEDISDRVQQSLGALGTNHIFSIFLKLKSTTDTFNVRLANNQGERVEAVVSTDGTMVAGGATTATNYDIENYGNGWYRLWMETTTSATSNFYQLYPNITNTSVGKCYFYGAQIEQGSYPTSYIPNHSGGSVTRNADVNTLLNQSGVIGQTAGTILFDAYFDEEGKVNFSISDSSANNFISIETTSSNEVTAKVEQGGSTQATITTATSFFAEGDRLKCAIAYDDRDMAFYINGTQVNTAAPNLIPACDDIRFGNYDGSIKADQRVNRVVLFTTRISNGNLATLTS